ncbi:MAG: BON domain-containing protein [Hydrogenophaga sp.]|uniref:BON domain-containing protein n=1 Tax=Hydrogenophaga sp. TaxID=1904254 RepID=UPI00258114C2|nr:BON domain-containing protein [Hydrogenophaga sp.]MBL0944284.1 BON domain-containing protein [Hydrogenophaga sp.]
MKTDSQLKIDIEQELAWDRAIDAGQIGVAVRRGIATVSGTLDTFAQKFAVERAVRRVAGVRGIALDLEVCLPPDHARSDREIAEAALNALQWHSLVPDGRVRVEVQDGLVRLVGDVDWDHQRVSAEHAVRPLRGVRGVANGLLIKPRANPREILLEISSALERHADREARRISIDVDGGVVTLRGTVDSLADRRAAVGTAYAAKGVLSVVDQIEVAF